MASHVGPTSDGREQWTAFVPTDARLAGPVSLAVHYRVEIGDEWREFWDNNCGVDYLIPAHPPGQGGNRVLEGRDAPCPE